MLSGILERGGRFGDGLWSELSRENSTSGLCGSEMEEV